MKHDILLHYSVLAICTILLVGCTKKSDDYLRSGIENLKNHQSENALSDFNNAIKLDSNNARAYFERGFIKSRSALTKPDGADFSKYIELTAHDLAVAYVARAWTRETHQQYDIALEDLDRAIAIDSDYIFGYVFKERVLSESKDTLQLRKFIESIDEKTRQKMAENRIVVGVPVEVPTDIAKPTARNRQNNDTGK